MKIAGALVFLLLAAGSAASAGATPATPSSPASQAALDDIPPAYLVLYQQAGQHFQVPWQLLAAIGRVESDHGRNPNAYTPNYAGAVGPMQFLPSTFAEYAWAAGTPDPNILDPHDAIFAAAAMLTRNGVTPDVRGAVFSYNHADWYVDLVLGWARRYGWAG
jgi:membrane-bound lytic murein transglycosylase B